MKILSLIIQSIISVLFTSADPNLFGSRKRRKEKEKLAKEMKSQAAGIQTEIEAAQSANPFESAAAKSAMAQSARKAKQTQQRYANMMGANASPEAMIAAQQATQEAVSGTAGDIATGAEALKQSQISQLRGEKSAMLGQAYGTQMSAINERGKGWTDFFGAVGQIGQAASGIAEGGSAIAGLIASDIRFKENISFAGNYKGHNLYHYNYKNGSVPQIGVIAQEVEITNPEAIVYVDGYRFVNYNMLFNN